MKDGVRGTYNSGNLWPRHGLQVSLVYFEQIQ